MRKGDDLTTFIVPKSQENPEALTYQIPKDRLRPVAEKRDLLPGILGTCLYEAVELHEFHVPYHVSFLYCVLFWGKSLKSRFNENEMPLERTDFSLLQNFQTNSGTHSADAGTFPEGKAVGA